MTYDPNERGIGYFGHRSGRDTVGTIGIPIRDYVHGATVMSLMQIDWSFLPSTDTVDFNIVRGNILTSQRNELIKRMRGDWIVFIDDDMTWQPDAVGRLITTRAEHDFDILGGLCYRRQAPYEPTLFFREQPTAGNYNYLERWDTDIVEVDATGMAFIVIHKRVFEGIAQMVGQNFPSYEERVLKSSPPNFFRWEGTLGEDLRFCADAKRAGFRIMVDTRIEIGHIGELEIKTPEFLGAVAQRKAGEQIIRERLNDGMGMPSLTPTEARERLGW